jgi:hypothetical protein
MSEEQLESWAVVSLMGHKTLAGRLSEEERFGAKMGRLDVPDGDKFATFYFGGASVYSIEVVTEEVARKAAKSHVLRPVHVWTVPEGKTLEEPLRQLSHHREFGDSFIDDECEAGEEEEPPDPPFGGRLR